LPDPPGQTWNRNALRLGGQQLDPIAESVLPLPEEELVDRDPFLRVNVLRAPRLVKPSLSADEMTKVLPVARTGRNRYRDEAVLLFILDTGARTSGLLGLLGRPASKMKTNTASHIGPERAVGNGQVGGWEATVGPSNLRTSDGESGVRVEIPPSCCKEVRRHAAAPVLPAPREGLTVVTSAKTGNPSHLVYLGLKRSLEGIPTTRHLPKIYRRGLTVNAIYSCDCNSTSNSMCWWSRLQALIQVLAVWPSFVSNCSGFLAPT
jgi:hypothetical protein